MNSHEREGQDHCESRRLEKQVDWMIKHELIPNHNPTTFGLLLK